MAPTPTRSKLRRAADATVSAPRPISDRTRIASRRRVALEAASPEIDAGRFPAKAIIGDSLRVEVDAFADGHDAVAGVVRFRHESERRWRELPLRDAGNDRWFARLPIEQLGRYRFTFAAWIDAWGTWRRDLRKRLDAGQDLTVDLQIGARIVRRSVQLLESSADRDGAAAAVQQLGTFLTMLEAGGEQAQAVALGDELDAVMRAHPDRDFETTYDRELEIVVDRERARFSSWYERFPRSTALEPGEHGTFADLQRELPRVAAMGFDVLYLPPIHPIGRDHRKGPNNAVTAGAGDPGSPWAIGSAEGGHTEIHPALGTLDDFQGLLAAAQQHGLEVALDLAYQCAPDHPWVQEHPTWFRQRPDGSIQYAENPPKKYQDIYPIDFETDDWEALWHGLKSVVDTWVARGVRIFRVDNPHTKAFPFWEWMIGEVRAANPDVIFLSEAFTRPKVMMRLAKLGFTQSYTYFTWRQEKWELEEYLRELTESPAVDVFRPNFWPNTPDILTEQLQRGDRGTYVTRMVLAATLSSSWGIYGPAFELREHEPVREGSEEYLDSEKYQLRHRDLSGAEPAGSLAEMIALVNRARAEHPALQRNDTLRFHPVDNDRLMAYSKSSADGSDVVLVIVNLDPEWSQAGVVHLDLDALGVPSDDTHYEVRDLIGGATYVWHGPHNYVELDPNVLPAHVFHVRALRRDEHDFDGW